MEVVIRTAHGGADIDLVSYDDDATLRDVIDTVTGLAVPTVVNIDGRPCRIDERVVDAIETAGLRVGSIIDVASDRGTEPGDDDGEAPIVRMRQLTGRGSGVEVDLPIGRYRFGAGRRLGSTELGRATVEEEAFTVTVRTRPRIEVAAHPSTLAEDDTDVTEVTVRPGANVAGELGSFTPMLGGELFDRELVWAAEDRLSVGGRVFDLAPTDDGRSGRSATIGAARIGDADRNGVRSFDAAGTLAVLDEVNDSVPDLPTISALGRVADPTRILWRRPPGDGPLLVPIGLSADHRSTVSIDLDRHTGVAAAGSSDFTSGIARTMLVELATMLGPGDLDIVIVASAGRLGRWDWTKWLPHVRGGDLRTTPRFLSTDEELERWVSDLEPEPDQDDVEPSIWDQPTGRPAEVSTGTNALGAALPPPVGRPHARPTADASRRRTLLLVDDAAHWVRRESPIRSMLIDPPPSMKVLAIVDRVGDAPSACTVVIDERPPAEVLHDGAEAGAADSPVETRLFGSLCRHVERLGASPMVTTDVRPSLTELPTALRIARAISSYDDLRVRLADDGDDLATRSDRPTLGDVLAVSSDEDPDLIPIGRRLDTTVDDATELTWDGAATLDLAHASITALAVDPAERPHLLGAITLGAAARHRAEDYAILLVADESPAWLSSLPHLIGTVDGDDTEQVGRVIRRVATTLARDPEFQLLVVIDGAVTDDGPPRLSDATAAFTELATSLDRVHLVVSAPTEHADMLRRHLGSACGAFVEGRPDGTATLARRQEGLELGTAVVMPTLDIVLPTARSTPPPAPSASLQVRPFVFGRPLSPIERRLARRNDPLRAAIADDGDVFAPEPGRARSPVTMPGDPAPDRAGALLPPPFPDRVGQETLLTEPGEANEGMLPLAIVERADGPGVDVFRWAPEWGSLFAVGHRRAGTNVLPDLVAVALVGVDADVWVLDPLPQRRRAFRRLPNCRKTTDPDSTTAIMRFIEEAEARVDHLHHGHLDDLPGSSSDALAEAVRGGPRPLVIVVADLNRTLAPFDEDGAADVIRRLTAMATPPDGRRAAAGRPAQVSLVATASRRDEIEPMLGIAADVLVGALDDLERRRFGVPDRAVTTRPASDTIISGRCWSMTRQRLVQLAAPPDAIEGFIRERVHDLAVTTPTADEPDEAPSYEVPS